MTEALRLIGLTQDGSLLTVVLACTVVWMTLTVRHWREDVAALRKSHEKMDGKIDRLAAESRADHKELSGKLERLAADVAYLRGRAERDTE